MGMSYLKLTSYEDALGILLAETRSVVEHERIGLENSLNRVLYSDIESPIDVPPYVKSQMDGYAIKASDTFSASEDAPVELEIIDHIDAGDEPTKDIKSGTCSYVATGSVLPSGADSVVMIEDAVKEDGKIRLLRSQAPGDNLMGVGYDIKRGSMVIARGERLFPRRIATLSGIGISEVDVYRSPRIAIISTGSEIILPGEEHKYGMTYDVNGAFLTNECRRLGCEVRFLGVAEDSREGLMEKLGSAEGSDVILVSAGVSKGAKDLMENTLAEVGEIILHGINIKPGKPTLASRYGSSLLIGLPGHPTSCVMIFKMLVEPLINRVSGAGHIFTTRQMKLMKRVVATKGRKQFLPVRINGENIFPVFRGSGAITSFLNADGIAIIDENTEYLDPGDVLEVVLLDD